MQCLCAGLIVATGFLSNSGLAAETGHDLSIHEIMDVSEALREMGFLRWKALKLEGGVWKVKAARHRNGRDYDLNVDPNTQMVIKHELND